MHKLLFSSVFGISFILGMLLLFLGCNPYLENQCVTYHVINTTVYGYKFVSKTCSSCESEDVNGNCNSYNYYPCYDSYLRLNYHGNNTCTYLTASNLYSEQSAANKALKYPIGEHMRVLKDKGNIKCSPLGSGLDAWIAGVVFLSLGALVFVLYVSWLLVMYAWEKYQAAYHHPAPVQDKIVEIEAVAVEIEEK
jgi:hypothetical protein